MHSQIIQAKQYSFPYHHLPTVGDGIALARHWPFAASYVAAFDIVSNELAKLKTDVNKSIKHVDIGCGDGALLAHLEVQEQFSGDSFTGVDMDSNAISWARMFARQAEFQCGDIKDLGEAKYGSATMIEVLEHIPPSDIPSFLNGVRFVLRDGATLILTVPSIHKPLAEKHFQHFTAQKLRECLEGNFSSIEIWGFERRSTLTAAIERLRINRFAKIDSPYLNDKLVKSYAKLWSNSAKCGRLLAIAKI